MTADMPDFSRSGDLTIKFRVDGDIFEAFSEVGAEVLLEATAPISVKVPADDASTEEQQAFLLASHENNLRCFRFLQDALLPSSRDRFAERMKSASEPITLRQALSVYRFLVQTYSGRPTQPPSPSLDGDGGTGESSTDTVRLVDLTPDSSPGSGSLT